MKNLTKILLLFIILFLVSCELVDTKITPDEPPPTTDVRYVVQMTSSSINSNPTITYTNSAGGTTQQNTLSLDLTVPIDSGTTAFLSASCRGYFSPPNTNASAAVDIKIFIADSLVADSAVIKTDRLSSVTANASVSVKID